MAEPVEFSRPAAVARALGGEDTQRFQQKRILLQGDADYLRTPNGHEAFRAAFLLLIRICQDVSVLLPGECTILRADIEALAERYVPERPWQLAQSADLSDFDAILSVGLQGRADLPWTVINSDGWIASVSSRGGDLPRGSNRANAVGAIGAACLGVGEIFKRLIKLKSGRGALLDVTSFSLWSYRPEEIDDGPELTTLPLDILLIGCGAIGSGAAYLLSRLPVSGRAFALDRQTYRRENFGTSIIVGPSEYETPKAQVVADFLRPKLDAQALPMSIEEFKARYDGGYPDVVLTGLDEVDPRHEVQHLWPGLIIDGAVGGELSCQVSCHPCSGTVACLLCVFQKPVVSNLAAMYARATGLPVEIANNQDATVTDEIIAAATEDRRPWLRSHLGKRLCSITSEAVATFLSADPQREGFAPAVPFVSCFSSCMIVTELVRYVMTGKPATAPRFQLNLLWGPGRGQHYDEDRRDDCYCVERAKNIAKLRTSRGHLS